MITLSEVKLQVEYKGFMSLLWRVWILIQFLHSKCIPSFKIEQACPQSFCPAPVKQTSPWKMQLTVFHLENCQFAFAADAYKTIKRWRHDHARIVCQVVMCCVVLCKVVLCQAALRCVVLCGVYSKTFAAAAKNYHFKACKYFGQNRACRAKSSWCNKPS